MRTYRHGPGSYFAYFQRNENRFYRKSLFRFSQRVISIRKRIFCWRRITTAQDHTGGEKQRTFFMVPEKYIHDKIGGAMLTYSIYDKKISAAEFITFANQVWPGDYDPEKTAAALAKTINITARDNGMLVGALRILSDGYFFGTITELLVLPAYQGQGIGSRLLKLAGENTPTMLYFGSQPGLESFYENNGCVKSLQSYVIDKH